MNKVGLTLAAVIAVAVMVAPSVFADNYCVVRDSLAQTGVSSGEPAYGWSRVAAFDCFITIDAAQRAAGTGANSALSDRLKYVHPNAIPIPGEPFVNKALP